MSLSPINSITYNKPSDTEESIDEDDFEWGQLFQDGVVRDGFLPWLLDPDYEPATPMRMNCAQGAIVYIDRFDGGVLAQELRDKFYRLKRITDSVDKTIEELYKDFSPYLGLDKAQGPFALSKVDEIWQSQIVKPGSVISFGNKSDNVHIAVVTKDKNKMRSLWVHPQDSTRAPFGKYPYKVVFNDAVSFLAECSDEKKKELKASEVFYVSNRFCHFFNQ